MIYLASPYTHPDAEVREARCKAAEDYMAYMLSNREWAISPIASTHYLATRHKLPGDHLFWMEYDARLINICDEVRVLGIPGWQESKGVKHELEYAWLAEKKRTIAHYDSTLELWRVHDLLV